MGDFFSVRKPRGKIPIATVLKASVINYDHKMDLLSEVIKAVIYYKSSSLGGTISTSLKSVNF